MAHDRQTFAPDEMAMVLSHYDLGVIQSAKEYPRGSRKSPKLLLVTERGRYLLKRRAAGRDDPDKVAFSHALVKHLRERGFPVPALVGTRDEGDSLLQLNGRVYELFRYVAGNPYDESLEATMHAGKTLARYHRAVQEFRTDWLPPKGSFHDSPAVRSGLNAIPTTLSSHDSVFGHEAELLSITQELYEHYDEAADAVNARGYDEWAVEIVHGDWHPGNMRFRGHKVAVVLDLDAARRQPRIVDVANAMLQFSILRGRSAPSEWPAFFDETRMRRFLTGYLLRRQLGEQQRRAVPDLMIESLIAESVVPIAATGSFGRIPGFGVLQMVRRKVRWLIENTAQLLGWLVE
ncbi:MAG: phosphotransferase [Planctomycetes bacterium]|nr:phosphotransferase [Planctomycetota bacterium]